MECIVAPTVFIMNKRRKIVETTVNFCFSLLLMIKGCLNGCIAFICFPYSQALTKFSVLLSLIIYKEKITRFRLFAAKTTIHSIEFVFFPLFIHIILSCQIYSRFVLCIHFYALEAN